MRPTKPVWIAFSASVALAVSVHVCADPQSDTVTIDYPDTLPLEALVDYVSRTLDVQVLYGDELRGKEVTLRPGHIELPRSRLLDLLRSVLQVRGLALVEDRIAGFYRVATAEEVPRLTTTLQSAPVHATARSGRVVTQIIKVASDDTKSIATRIKPFTSSPKASVMEIPEQGLILVTDYEPVIARIQELVGLIDAPESVVTETIPIRHLPASTVATRVTAVLTAQQRGDRKDGAQATILADVAPDGLVVTGSREAVEAAIELIKQFDVSDEIHRPMRSYAPKHASASRIKTLIERLILATDDDAKRIADVFVDDAVNRVYVTAPINVHNRVRELLETEDQPVVQGSRRMRVYRPQNRTASEILDTLTQLLEEATEVTGTSAVSLTHAASVQADSRDRPPGRNRLPAAPGRGQVPPMPPAQVPIEAPEEAAAGPRRIEGPDYVLTEDEATNAIIAVGTPELHSQLEQLIAELDRRPAQVMIEMTLVAISLSDSLSLGIELEALDLGGGLDFLLFSNFGLSSIDTATGQRVLAPGVGANGVLLRPNDVPVILKALATHGDNRVVSAPRILVSDNTSATLRSVDEAPFTSINASDTIATTSFAGFESAGTTLTVTPHIAQGDHLTLTYNLNFSNFSGSSSDAAVPPPRTTNSFTGEVQVPDGFTVVVGGLEVENESDTVSEVPLLGQVPVLGALFQNSSTARTKSRVYAFIRPVILRDDQFADLRYLSDETFTDAEIENPDFPPDQLMWMK